MDAIDNMIPEYRFMIRGAGRVNDKTFCTEDFAYNANAIPVQSAPQKFTVSIRSGKTVYDVTASFSQDGDQTLFRQFEKLMQP